MSRQRGPIPRTPKKRVNKFIANDCFGDDGSLVCFCDNDGQRIEVELRTTQKQNHNHGRQFYACDNPHDHCGFFLWANEVEDKLGRPWNPKGAGAAVTSSWNANQKKKNGSRLTEHSDGDSDDDSDVDLFKNGSGQSQQKKKNKRLLDSPTASRTSDLALVKKRKGNSDRARSPSPDWPDPEELQQEVERLKRENSALKRQIKDAGERESRRDEEVRDLKKENDAFLKQLYPELFRHGA